MFFFFFTIESAVCPVCVCVFMCSCILVWMERGHNLSGGVWCCLCRCVFAQD